MNNEDTINKGDVVRIDFNNAQRTLCLNATVLFTPLNEGDSWVFKSNIDNTIFYVSEACTITKLPKTEITKLQKTEKEGIMNMEKTKGHKDIQAHYDVMNSLRPSMPYDVEYMVRYRYWYPQGPEARHVLEERGW